MEKHVCTFCGEAVDHGRYVFGPCGDEVFECEACQNTPIDDLDGPYGDEHIPY